jgi:hypothetical protein
MPSAVILSLVTSLSVSGSKVMPGELPFHSPDQAAFLEYRWPCRARCGRDARRESRRGTGSTARSEGRTPVAIERRREAPAQHGGDALGGVARSRVRVRVHDRFRRKTREIRRDRPRVTEPGDVGSQAVHREKQHVQRPGRRPGVGRSRQDQRRCGEASRRGRRRRALRTFGTSERQARCERDARAHAWHWRRDTEAPARATA